MAYITFFVLLWLYGETTLSSSTLPNEEKKYNPISRMTRQGYNHTIHRRTPTTFFLDVLIVCSSRHFARRGQCRLVPGRELKFDTPYECFLGMIRTTPHAPHPISLGYTFNDTAYVHGFMVLWEDGNI